MESTQVFEKFIEKPETHLGQALSNFVVCGLLRSPLPPDLQAKLHRLAPRTFRLGDYGLFFFTTPLYLDWASNEDSLLLKLGFARTGDDYEDAAAVLASGTVTPSGVDAQLLRGNALVVCMDRRQPRLCVYKTQLSIQEWFYIEIDQSLFMSNNLGTLAHFLGLREINPEIVPTHFIFETATGKQTYFKHISRLLPGEILHIQETGLRVELRLSLRDLAGDEYGKQPLQKQAVDDYFDQLKTTMRRYLKATTEMEPHWTMLLSGGIDSSLLQLAVNQLLPPGIQATSHTAAPEIGRFATEVEYARAASQLFGTRHTFVPVPAVDYPGWLVASIKIVGRPPGSELFGYRTPLHAYLACQPGPIKYMFSGQGTEGIHGIQVAKFIDLIMRFRKAPRSAFSALGYLLNALPPIDKVRSARRAVAMLKALPDPDTPGHPFNAHFAFTDWPTVYRCFTTAQVRQALHSRREMQVETLNSDNLTEQVHIVYLLSEASDQASVEHQLALAYGGQIIFPYLEDDLLRACFRFDPCQRFYWGGRTKPILKQILETRTTSNATRLPKRGGAFRSTLFDWMRQGVLREMVADITRPGFLSREDYERCLRTPNMFTWNLLTYDLFEKHVVNLVNAYTQ